MSKTSKLNVVSETAKINAMIEARKAKMVVIDSKRVVSNLPPQAIYWIPNDDAYWLASATLESEGWRDNLNAERKNASLKAQMNRQISMGSPKQCVTFYNSGKVMFTNIDAELVKELVARFGFVQDEPVYDDK